MSRKIQQASAIAVVAMVAATLFSAEGSGAFAQDSVQAIIEDSSSTSAQAAVETPATTAAQGEAAQVTAREVAQPLPQEAEQSDQLEAVPTKAHSLAELVSSTPTDEALSREMQCLAGAIYFEAKGEPLGGQLAVGRVVVDRSQSGRFPSTYCGVVYQRAQFSFVRGGAMPAINTSSRAWREARAIAQIAHDDSWESPAKGALFFHARHVSPGWRLKRVAQVENHVFYR